MKKPLRFSMFFFLLMIVFSSYVKASPQVCPTVYEQLVDLNKYWQHVEIKHPKLAERICFDAHEDLIQLHLQLVEGYLQEHVKEGLTVAQKVKRQEGLAILKSYRLRKQFPTNNHHPGEVVPYFIDDFGVACAVGHMVRETGFEDFAEKIKAENNFAYIEDMNYPELSIWAETYGFTEMELRWIQPGYSNCSDYVDIWVTNANDSGVGSFRWAIDQANTDGVANIIKFNLPNENTPIFINTSLPWLTENCTIIDGTTQGGQNGYVIIDAANASLTNSYWMLVANNEESIILGLWFRNVLAPFTAALGAWESSETVFAQNILTGNTTGIAAGETASQVTITSNIIGLSPSQNMVLNNENGIDINNVTSALVSDNIIAGNTNSGIIVQNTQYADIIRNYIGVNESQSQIFPNLNTGVWIGSSSDVTINENIITGDGNNTWGIFVQNTQNVNLGYLPAELGNTISDNYVGIGKENTDNLNIEFNALSCNIIPIWLSDQNFFTSKPTVTSATIQQVAGTGPTDATISLFLHESIDCPNATCQGNTYIGTVQANANGDWTYTGDIPTNVEITALATQNGDTSEYADCATVQTITGDCPVDFSLCQQWLQDTVTYYSTVFQVQCPDDVLSITKHTLNPTTYYIGVLYDQGFSNYYIERIYTCEGEYLGYRDDSGTYPPNLIPTNFLSSSFNNLCYTDLPCDACPSTADEVLCLDWVQDRLILAPEVDQIATATFSGQQVILVGHSYCPEGVVCFVAGWTDVYTCTGIRIATFDSTIDSPEPGVFSGIDVVYNLGDNFNNCEGCGMNAEEILNLMWVQAYLADNYVCASGSCGAARLYTSPQGECVIGFQDENSCDGLTFPDFHFYTLNGQFYESLLDHSPAGVAETGYFLLEDIWTCDQDVCELLTTEEILCQGWVQTLIQNSLNNGLTSACSDYYNAFLQTGIYQGETVVVFEEVCGMSPGLSSGCHTIYNCAGIEISSACGFPGPVFTPEHSAVFNQIINLTEQWNETMPTPECMESCSLTSDEILCLDFVQAFILESSDICSAICPGGSPYAQIVLHTDETGSSVIELASGCTLVSEVRSFYDCNGGLLTTCTYSFGTPQNCNEDYLDSLNNSEEIWTCFGGVPDCGDCIFETAIGYDIGLAQFNLGETVSVFEDIIVAGTHQYAVSGEGAVHIYAENNGIWERIELLQSNNPVDGDGFGKEVYLNSEILVVNQRPDPNSSANQKTIVFEDNGNSWEITHEIPYTGATDINASDLLICTFDDFVYLHEENNGIWSSNFILSNPETYQNGFGSDVGLENNFMVIGTMWDQDVAYQSGAVYIVEQVNGNWTTTQKIKASDAAVNDAFGREVETSADKIFVGAWFNDEVANRAGAVYVFEKMNGTWQETQKIIPPFAQNDLRFGTQLTYHDGILAVGCDAPHSGNEESSVFLFEENGSGQFVLAREILPVSEYGATSATFGSAISLHNNNLVVGHRGADYTDFGPGAGFLFIYDLDCDNSTGNCTMTSEEILCQSWLLPIMENLSNECVEGCIYQDSRITLVQNNDGGQFVAVANQLTCQGPFIYTIYTCEGAVVEECEGNYLVVGASCLDDLNPEYSFVTTLWTCTDPIPDCSTTCPVNQEDILCLDWLYEMYETLVSLCALDFVNISTYDWQGDILISVAVNGIGGTQQSYYDCNGNLVAECNMGVGGSNCDPITEEFTFIEQIWACADGIPNCSSTPPWVVVPTSVSHTVILLNDLQSDIDGTALAAGDYVGFFYEHNGQEYCAGFGEWTATGDVTITVFGNDTNAPDKNGFDEDETFTVHTWQASTQVETNINATYLPIGSLGGIVDATNLFGEDAFSAINEINTGACVSIDLQPGTQYISSYVVPENTALVDLINPIAGDIIELKNDAGQAIIPSFNIYDPAFTDWEITEGYKIKMLNAATLEICGQKADPLTTPIPIATGVQWIGYLRDNPSAPTTQMQSASNCILWMKNDDGESYIPALNPPGNMNEMVPTEGYKLKASCEGTVTYTQNFMGTNGIGEFLPTVIENQQGRNNELLYFRKGENTGKDATLVIPNSVISEVLQVGDEVAVFTTDGILCGANVYNGDDFYITIWGDDASTVQQEGLLEGEEYLLKGWREEENLVFDLSIALVTGNTLFEEDALQIAAFVGITTSIEEVLASNTWQLFPNPANQQLTITYFDELATLPQFNLLNAQGQLIRTYEMNETANGFRLLINTIEFSSGIYWCQLKSQKGNAMKKIVIQH